MAAHRTVYVVVAMGVAYALHRNTYKQMLHAIATGSDFDLCTIGQEIGAITFPYQLRADEARKMWETLQTEDRKKETRKTK